MTKVSMTVNGKPVSGDVEGRTLLVNFLRQDLHLTGTHVAVIPANAALAPCTLMALP